MTSPEPREIQYGQIPALEKQIAEVEKAEAVDLEPLVGEEVGAEQIADVVEAWTGIPTGKMLQGETAKLLEMESVIGERLIGQREAVDRGQRRRTPLARRHRRPQPADRVVPLPRTRPARARPSSPRRSRTSSSTTSGRSSAST